MKRATLKFWIISKLPEQKLKFLKKISVLFNHSDSIAGSDTIAGLISDSNSRSNTITEFGLQRFYRNANIHNVLLFGHFFNFYFHNQICFLFKINRAKVFCVNWLYITGIAVCLIFFAV